MKKLLPFIKNPWLLAVLGTVGAYALFGFLLVPFLVRHYAPPLIAGQIKREASVEAVRFNPFALVFELEGFNLKDKDGSPLVSLNHLLVDFDLESLWQQAFVFGDLIIETPKVNAVMDAEGQLNLAKISDDLPPSTDPPAPPGPPPKLLLKHFALKQGEVTYTHGGATENISPLNLELEDVSTLPDQYGLNTLDAKLEGGGSIHLDGRFSLEPVSAEGDFKLEGFNVAVAWKLIQEKLNLSEPTGKLSLATHYHFKNGNDQPEVKLSKLGFKLEQLGLKLAEPAQPLITLDKIQWDEGEFDLSQHSVKLPNFLIEKGQVHAALDEQGAVNWAKLVKAPAAPAATPTPAKIAPAPPVTPAQPAGNAPAPAAPPPTPAKANTPPTPTSPAPANPQTAAADPVWQVELGGFKLAELAVIFEDASRNKPYSAGLDSIGLEFAAKAEAGSGPPKAQVNQLKLDLKGIHLDEPDKDKKLFSLDALSINPVQVSLQEQKVQIGQITLQGGGVDILRTAEGRLPLVEIFAAKPGSETTPPPAQDKPQEAAPPWQIALDHLSLQGFKLGFADASFNPPLAYNADSIDIQLDHINYPGTTPVNVDAKIRLKQGGNLSIKGTASPAGDNADAKVQLDKLNLAPLQTLVSQFAKLKLDSADLSANLQTNFHQMDAGPQLKASGTVGVGKLKLMETGSGDRLLAWKNLAVNGIDFGLKPDKLNIKEVVVTEPGVKVAIDKNKSNNFSDAMIAQAPSKTAADPAKPESKPTPPPAPAAEPAKPKSPKSKGKAIAKIPDASAAKTAQSSTSAVFPVKVERVRLDNSAIDYSDQSLVIPFSTHIHNFGGIITDVSTSQKTRSQVKLWGQIEKYGEAKVEGSLIPTNFKAYSQINVVFRNVEMSSLSPYSATFAGRKITSGKLNVDLAYTIENSQLKSQNTVMLEQFTLGEEVQSPGATNLPLDLAVGLLKDGDGRIQATVPITGDLNNPKFEIGPVLWDAFVTLIKTTVTAPFRALGSLLGIEGGEDLGAILFQPGLDSVPPPEKEKLLKVIQALGKRPNLKLTIDGGYDPNLDSEAMRGAQVRIAVIQLTGIKTTADPGPLSLSDDDTQKALEDFAEKRGGPNFLDPVQAEFEQAKGRKPKRMKGFGSGLGKASEDVDFYEKAYQFLVQKEPLPDSALEDLAQRRIQAIMKELQGQPGFNPARMQAGKPKSVSEPRDGKVPSPLDLGSN